MLISGVGRQLKSGGRRTVNVSVPHAKGDFTGHAVTAANNELQRIRSISERRRRKRHRTLLPTRLLRQWPDGKGFTGLPEDAHLMPGG